MVRNRIDPALVEACFTAWAGTLRPDAPGLIALDGNPLGRSGDERRGPGPVHPVPARAELVRGHAKRRLVGWTA